MFNKFISQPAMQAFMLIALTSTAIAGGDTHHGKSSGGGLPQLDPTWYPSQLFWLIVVFAFLYLFFSRSILPSISSAIENRQDQIQGDLDTAERLREEAEDVQKAYEALLEEARHKASQLHIEVDNSIKEKTTKELEAFQEKMSKEIKLAEIRIGKSKQEAMDDITAIAAEIASEAAQKIIGKSADINQVKDVVKDLNNKAKAA